MNFQTCAGAAKTAWPHPEAHSIHFVALLRNHGSKESRINKLKTKNTMYGMTSIVLCFVGGDLLQNPVVFMFVFLNHVYIEIIIYTIYIYIHMYVYWVWLPRQRWNNGMLILLHALNVPVCVYEKQQAISDYVTLILSLRGTRMTRDLTRHRTPIDLVVLWDWGIRPDSKFAKES